jgi:protoporphyrinogen oxidase
VQPHERGIEIATDSRRELFDRALITLAPPLAVRVCPTLTSEERARCLGVEYQGIICASALLETPLTPYYITNIADDTMPFTAVIEMTALVDRDEVGGNALVYLPKYVTSNDTAFRLDDAAIEESFLGGLERMHRSFSRKVVRAFRVSRVPFVFPIPTLDYSKRLPPIRTTTPGLFMASSANIVNGTLNVNETVCLANGVTPLLIAESAEALPLAVVA